MKEVQIFKSSPITILVKNPESSFYIARASIVRHFLPHHCLKRIFFTISGIFYFDTNLIRTYFQLINKEKQTDLQGTPGTQCCQIHPRPPSKHIFEELNQA